MKRFLLIAAALLLAAMGVYAQPEPGTHVGDYLYFSVNEQTEFGEIIWFYWGDDLCGPVRSDDWIGVKGNPRFYDWVITTKDEFIRGSGFNPEFSGPAPIFQADSLNDVEFFTVLEEARLGAMENGLYYDTDEGQLQSRLVGEAAGWHVYQWAAGTPFPEEGPWVVDEIHPYTGFILYFEGNLELYGDHVQGFTTIGVEGTVKLLDDIVYVGVHDRDWSTDYVYDGLERLAIVAGEKILIANTVANGKGNGAGEGNWMDHSNKHIQISANILTPTGTFTFENQNNSPDDPYGWDGYWWCDPEGQHAGQPDERGAIYLYGSLAMNQRGYVHRSNCGGTGYDKFYVFDRRYLGASLPAFYEQRSVDLSNGDVTWSDTTISIDSADELYLAVGEGTLTLGPGTRIEVNTMENEFMGSIFRNGRIAIAGTADNPVEIAIMQSGTRFYDPFAPGQLVGDAVYGLHVSGKNLILAFPGELQHVQLDVNNALIQTENEDGFLVDDCYFRGSMQFSDRIYELNHTVVVGNLDSPRIVDICNTTFAYDPAVNNGSLALSMWESGVGTYTDMTNVAFFGDFTRLISSTVPTRLSYCTWNRDLPTNVLFSSTVSVITGNIAGVDPLFWDVNEHDYHLRQGSPLIDTGNPDVTADPDGSRADIGAYPYDPFYLSAPEVDEETGLPLQFAVASVNPNPFNGMATVSITLPRATDVQVNVYDLLGREVATLHRGYLSAGRHQLSLTLHTQPSGLYFIAAQAGQKRSVTKAMLVK